MKKLLFICWLSLVGLPLFAQTTKPAVLVVGNGNAATAAAIQSAVSGVKTTLLLQAGGFDIHDIGEELNSGIRAGFVKRYQQQGNEADTFRISVFDKHRANETLKAWTDTLKNLTVIRNVNYTKAGRSGNGWFFRLSDGSTIRPKLLVVAGDEKLLNALNIPLPAGEKISELNYTENLYRTSIGAGMKDKDKNDTFLSFYHMLIPAQENIIALRNNDSMLSGQAAGAMAAYAGFFDTKLSLANLKAIQGELLNYKLALMPFTDVETADPNWRAIQALGLTGVLKAEIKQGKAFFYPDKIVSSEEIKQPLKDFYYKAQLWFDDHGKEELTLEKAIDLICYVGQKSPAQVIRESEKNWTGSYKFKQDFDFKKPVTRRELAVLLQNYMPPFNVNIDKTGAVLR